MQFMMIYIPDPKARPNPNENAEMRKLIDESTKNGELLATGALQPPAQGARLQMSGGKVTVTDGPFTEAKEVVVGFAIMEAKSLDHAIEMGTRFLHVAGGGVTEVRRR